MPFTDPTKIVVTTQLDSPAFTGKPTLNGAPLSPDVILAGPGIDLTGVQDSTAALQAVLTAATPGAIIAAVPGSALMITASLQLTKPVTLDLTGCTLTQTTPGARGFRVTSGGVRIQRGKLIGPQFAVYTETERAIEILGVSAASTLDEIQVTDVDISSWGGHGVWAKWATHVVTSNNRIANIRRSGVTYLSVIGGAVCFNDITNITGSTVENAYGVAITRGSDPNLLVDPRSEDIDVSFNRISNVTGWEGLDTHSGKRIKFAYNTVRGCLKGIVVTTTGTGTDYEPQDCEVVGNVIDSLKTDGSAETGIIFNGFGAGGVRTNCATGSIVGNIVRGHGDQTNSIDGAILVQCTEGLAITGNVVFAPSPTGICVYHDNFDFTCTGNTVLDAFSNTVAVGQADGIWLRAGNNNGVIAGNTSAVTGAVTAAYVLTRGIEVADLACNVPEIGVNVSSSALPLLDGGSRSQLSLQGKKIGLLGATDFGSGLGVAAMKNATTPPTVNPAGGIVFYSEGGSLKFRGSNGVTDLTRQFGTAAVATDLPTVITLANFLRAALLAQGLIG